jgi:hypothetical protein
MAQKQSTDGRISLSADALLPEGTQVTGGEWMPAHESILDYTQVKSVIIDGRA